MFNVQPQPNLEKQVNQSSSIVPSPEAKFNLKYILIVLGLVILVSGGILAYQYLWLPKEEKKLPNISIKPPEEVVLEFYRCYLVARNKPIATLESALKKCDHGNLEENYKQRLIENERAREYLPADPLSLDQGMFEYDPQIDSVKTETTTASVIVTLSPKDAPDHKLKVTLLLINNEWKITNVKLVEEIDNWQTYRNEELGIEFKYPKSWGEIRESRFQGPTECGIGQRIVNGTQIRINFSESNYVNPNINIYFTSRDYKSAICFTDKEEIKLGPREERDLNCEPYPIGISRIFECMKMSIDNSPSIGWYDAIEDVQSCGYMLDKHIKIISPNENFPGIEIIAFIKGADYNSGCYRKGKHGPDINLEDFINMRSKQIKDNQLPLEAQQFLSEFDNFIKSIKFIK